MAKRKIITTVTSDGSVIFLEGHFVCAQASGFDTILICKGGPNSSKISANEQTKFKEVPFSREIDIGNDVTCLISLVSIFMREKPFIVNAGTPKASLLSMLAAWVSGVPYRIYTQHGFRHESLHGLSRAIQILVERITCHLATHVICVSPSVRHLGISSGFFSESKSRMLGMGSCGVSFGRLRDGESHGPSCETIKAAYGIQQQDFVIGFVGRIIPRKGIEELVSAFIEISQSRPNIKLLLVGGFEKAQPISEWCLNMIRNHDHIINVGYQNNVAAYMKVMNLFCMPSHWEGFGNTLVEAAYLGLPVITSNGTGSRDAVKDDYNGTVVSVGDKDALKRTIIRYLDYPDILKKHGENGPSWARRFDRNVINNELVAFYKSLP
ncbi:glycosyltransferase family 4 protein [Halomonas sp. EGI 63088]|uniref:Glycosyltransferase family 4 protein n=1 Tax=Halomonas flagellata TaxID=2920385 RepID=A0ABS9S004_9GAMM|nr:glycosyltransferase family 4 protein [Halomonas flagellata]MCH4565443.1 glycosyltransferase family 4 protein [Halomonas flagellata]